MKQFYAVVVLLLLASLASAQFNYTTAGYGYNKASIVFKTGYSDVACAGGVCLVPGDNGYYISSPPYYDYYGYYHPAEYGHYNNVAAIPQSTAFFALSNPQTFEFRVREFVQVPGTDAIISTDSYGNQVNVINAGIQPQAIIKSRGQTLFVR